MSHNTSWYIEEQILKTTFQGELTEAELRGVVDQAAALLATSEAPPYLLIDMHEVTNFPASCRNMINNIVIFRSMPTRPNAAFIVSDHPLLNFMSVLASKVTGIPLVSFPTRQALDQFIRQQLPDLASMLPVCESAPDIERVATINMHTFLS